MDTAKLVQVVLYLLTVALGGFALWYRSNAGINRRVSALIAEAENRYQDFTKAGGIKFEWVVTRLYELIPAAVRPFVPQTMIRTLVQATFDAIAGYAKLQLDRLAEKSKQTADMGDTPCLRK